MNLNCISEVLMHAGFIENFIKSVRKFSLVTYKNMLKVQAVPTGAYTDNSSEINATLLGH